ncbi:MAG: N-acetylmuramoyl-L-alanine amidase [Victivallaceae bacterium]|nr:N-acetylmuramoyl-L-alanine amidase [Victivallaceae bacterium]
MKLNLGKTSIWVALIAAVSLAGAARLSRICGQTYLELGSVAASLRARTASSGSQILFAKTNRRLSLTPEKKTGFFNNVRLVLNFAPVNRGGRGYVSLLDWNKSLLPLMGDRSDLRRPVGTIVIDAGHGGRDKGASGASSHEKNITLRAAGKLADRLRKFGFRVFLTRSRDTALSLESRPAIAAARRADLFISLHVNSATDRTINGIETFCLTPSGGVSASASKPEYAAYNGNRYDGNNMLLAYRIQEGLLKVSGAEDRGIKRARFAVLRDAKSPAVLIELGFISNRAEERKLNSGVYVDKLVRGIVNGILLYQADMLGK